MSLMDSQFNQIITRSRKRKLDEMKTSSDESSDDDYLPPSEDETDDDYEYNSEVNSESEYEGQKLNLKSYKTRSKKKKVSIGSDDEEYDEDYDDEYGIMNLSNEDKLILGAIFSKYLNYNEFDEDEDEDDEDYDDEYDEDYDEGTDKLLRLQAKQRRLEENLSTKEGSKESKKSRSNIKKMYPNTQDKLYFESLDSEKQNKIIELEKEISSINTHLVPFRFNILESNLDIKNKAIAIKKIDMISRMDSNSGEYHKIKSWIDGLLKIPFGKYIDLPYNNSNTKEEINQYLKETQDILNKKVYGHHEAKSHILQIISQWIVNPTSLGSVLAIQGPMGIGKTSLVKEGISKCLNRPCFFISLGGATDSSFLDGHSYTYEGSQPGKIIDILKNASCMNPIIYFDELDKISNTTKGDEITNLLIHITDPSQNSHFQDKYYTGIDIDLSRCLFIFSYNNIANVNPILLDRMYNIQLDDFKLKDKIIISRDYVLPQILENYKLTSDQIIFDEETLTYIIQNYSADDGIRNTKRCLETIVSKINLLRLGGGQIKLDYDIKNLDFPLKINIDIIRKLLSKGKKDLPPFQMYT